MYNVSAQTTLKGVLFYENNNTNFTVWRYPEWKSWRFGAVTESLGESSGRRVDSKIKNQSDLMSAIGQQSKLYSILESLNKNNKGEDKNKLVSVETSTFMKERYGTSYEK